MQKIVFFTGAGISAESGVKTFRDADGLWENHNIYEVATPEAFAANPKLVLEFYNARRRQMYEVEPNDAHRDIAALQDKFEVSVITQNIDNLHERAGSKNILHLHGELDTGRSSTDDGILVPLNGRDIKLGDLAPDGTQLRPHVVWFGEAVPALTQAVPIIEQADILVIVGTSLQVYPAAGLIDYARPECKVWYIDPKAEVPPGYRNNIQLIRDKAVRGVRSLIDKALTA
ncbi:MAG: NAD-dependent deacylase [Cryomorphaceae bacterium]|nr:NAD-dependent deacylase [Cryomorphaceae bacterium]